MDFEYTQEEKEQAYETYFSSRDPLVLSVFPAKEKKKYLTLLYIKDLFEVGKEYNHAQVTTILKSVYFDFATIRRYLVDYQFLNRTTDNRVYWVNTDERN